MLVLLFKLLSWIPNILPNILGTVEKLADTSAQKYVSATSASAAIASTATSADVAVNTLKAAEMDKDRAWWVTAWEKPLLFYVCFLHFAAIMLDSTFQLHWGIPKPPAPYDTYEGAVILSDVIVLGSTSLLTRVIGAIWK